MNTLQQRIIKNVLGQRNGHYSEICSASEEDAAANVVWISRTHFV